MVKGYKIGFKAILLSMYISLTGINLIGLKHNTWTCMENCISYQIWLTVCVILAYNVICAIYKSFKLWEGLERCKANMSKIKIK